MTSPIACSGIEIFPAISLTQSTTSSVISTEAKTMLVANVIAPSVIERVHPKGATTRATIGVSSEHAKYIPNDGYSRSSNCSVCT